MRRDVEDDASKVENCLKYLAAWINPEAYGKVYGKGTKPDMDSPYADFLKKMGVTDEDIEKFVPDTSTPDSHTEEPEDLDEVQVLRAPSLNNAL